MPKVRSNIQMQGGARITGLQEAVAADEPVALSQLSATAEASAEESAAVWAYFGL